MSSEEQIKKDDYYMGRALALAEEAFKKRRSSRWCRDSVSQQNYRTGAQPYRSTDRCYCPCGNAGYNDVSQRVRW